MDEARAQQLIAEHFGNAGVDEVKVQSIYTEDAVLEFPQGRERIRGKANIHAFRTVYPAKVTVNMWRTTFAGDTWIHEGHISYDGSAPKNTISIWKMDGEKVVHETIYIMDPWEPPAWRAQWVEPMTEL
jgi:hypothetical protein